MTKRVVPSWEAEKLPWSPWFWDHWLHDPGLRICNHDAKGLWMDMLCHMARSAERGFLIVGERVPTEKELSRLLGCEHRKLVRLLGELTRNGVLSRDERGAIFNRKMRREAEISRRSVENGVQGGNPMLLKTNEKTPKRVNPPVKVHLDSDSEKNRKKRNPADSLSPTAPERTAREAATPDEIPRAEPPLDAGPTPPMAVVQLDEAKAAREAERMARRGVPTGMRQGCDARLLGKGLEMSPMEMAAVAAFDRLARVSNLSARKFPLDAGQLAKLRKCLRMAGVEGFHEALAAAEASPLWQGRVGRGWKPGFTDFVAWPKFAKLLEGGYAADNPQVAQAVRTSNGRGGGGRPGPLDYMAARMGLHDPPAPPEPEYDGPTIPGCVDDGGRE